MAKKVEFDAHEKATKPFEVKFKTHGGKRVDFMADKKVKVPVHVKFNVKNPTR